MCTRLRSSWVGDRHVVVAQLGERAGRLDAGGAAADHHDAQVAVLAVDRGVLEVANILSRTASACERRVERHRGSAAPGMPKKLAVTPHGDAPGSRTRRRPRHRGPACLRLVSMTRRSLAEAHVGAAWRGSRAEPGDVAGVQAGGRHLVQQRLERVVGVRSTSVTSTSARLSLRTAAIPPNPPPRRRRADACRSGWGSLDMPRCYRRCAQLLRGRRGPGHDSSR